VHGNREEVITKYEEYLMSSDELLSSLSELKHKNLVCYCHPNSCHGDILLKFATIA